MKLSEMITIIIPTYNRYNRLLRLLTYFKSYNFPAKIRILDSSSDNLELSQLQEMLNEDCIEYVKFSSDISVANKINSGIKDLNTLYTVICADDDFVTPIGIKTAVEFLEKHKDYVVAHGIYTSFTLNGSNEKDSLWSIIYPEISIDQDFPEDRIFQQLGNYSVPTFYAVHRTDILKLIWEAAIEYTNDLRFGELLPAVLTVVYGKVKMLDVLFGAREWLATSDGRTVKRIPDFLIDGSFYDKYDKLKTCLVNSLEENEKIARASGEKIIDRAMNKYLENWGATLSSLPVDLKIKKLLYELNLLSIYKKLKYKAKLPVKPIAKKHFPYKNYEHENHSYFIDIQTVIISGL